MDGQRRNLNQLHEVNYQWRNLNQTIVIDNQLIKLLFMTNLVILSYLLT